MTKQKRIILLIAAALILISCAYVGFIFLRNMRNLNKIRLEQGEVRQELEDIQKENEKLKREKEYSGTDSFIQEMAREILGWVFPGEYRFVE